VEDGETLEQVQGLLRPLQMELQSVANLPKKDAVLRLPSRTRRQAALEKSSELLKTVEGWDHHRDIGQCCNEFIRGVTCSFVLNVL